MSPVDPAGAVDPLWGERPGEGPGTAWRAGLWEMALTDHGIEDLGQNGQVLAPRVFFSVRDESWATPPLRLSYATAPAAGAGDDGGPVAFAGSVNGFPLTVTGTVAAVGHVLVVTFVLEAAGDVAVARVGPCVLHDIGHPGTVLATDADDGRNQVELPDGITPHPIVSGYRHLELLVGGTVLRIDLTGGTFEMEDQRNWGDATLKSYCPPLAVARPLGLRAGERRSYALRFAADQPSATPAHRGARVLSSRVDLARLAQRPVPFLPRIGLTHPGGELGDAALEKLRELRAGFLHFLVDLGDAQWAGLLGADLSVAAALGVPAVVTLESPQGDGKGLARFAELAAGAVDTAFVFAPGSAVTTDALADTARALFAGTGIRIGAGSRGHFASLNLAGRVPDAAEVVAVALAGAAHDDDRRALTTGPSSYAAIVEGARRLAEGRDLYLGPIGLAPTFDSWSPPGRAMPVRRAFDASHRRHPTRFGAAWAVAAYAALAPLGVERLCLAGTIGGRGAGAVTAGRFSPFPLFDALRALGQLDPGTTRALSPGNRVAGLLGEYGALVAVLGDAPIELCRSDVAGRDLVASGLRLLEPARGDATRVAGPEVVALSWREDAS